MASILETFGASEELADFVCVYGALYGPRILIVVLLSAITIFRREMSCNRCYSTSGSEPTAAAIEESKKSDDWDDEGTEALLEEVGLYFSGSPLSPVIAAAIQMLQHDCSTRNLSAEEILDGAGYFCSGQPLTSALFKSSHDHMKPSLPIEDSIDAVADSECFPVKLPVDAQVQILSFLHPSDVVSFSCVSKTCNQVVNEGSSSKAVWKALWERDYGWIMKCWEVGRMAYARSGVRAKFSKEFYFRFGLSYISYILAGQNTFDRCLVGIGGHIYDLTAFLISHPGSPETVMVHAGRDATKFFETVGHSSGARRLAKSLCVAVDLSRTKEKTCGVRPTMHTDGDAELEPLQVPVPNVSSTADSNKLGGVQRIRDEFLQKEARWRKFASRLRNTNVVGEINVFYDPFREQFRAWYLNTSLETIFLDF